MDNTAFGANALLGSSNYIIGTKQHRVILKCITPFSQLKQRDYLVYEKGFNSLIYLNDKIIYNGLWQSGYFSVVERDLLQLIVTYHAMIPKWLTLYQCYKYLGWIDLFTNIVPHYFNEKLW